jgi:hypothetical protein
VRYLYGAVLKYAIRLIEAAVPVTDVPSGHMLGAVDLWMRPRGLWAARWTK